MRPSLHSRPRQTLLRVRWRTICVCLITASALHSLFVCASNINDSETIQELVQHESIDDQSSMSSTVLESKQTILEAQVEDASNTAQPFQKEHENITQIRMIDEIHQEVEKRNHRQENASVDSIFTSDHLDPMQTEDKDLQHASADEEAVKLSIDIEGNCKLGISKIHLPVGEPCNDSTMLAHNEKIDDVIVPSLVAALSAEQTKPEHEDPLQMLNQTNQSVQREDSLPKLLDFACHDDNSESCTNETKTQHTSSDDPIPQTNLAVISKSRIKVDEKEEEFIDDFPYSTAFNYASFDCGATVMRANSEAKSPLSTIIEDSSRYMRSPCSAKKWIVIELCEEILLRGLEMGNLEYFSSNPKDFMVLGSTVYPTENWMLLGVFQAGDLRTEQLYKIKSPQWVRYLKIRFMTHYGSEYYCPITIIRAFGYSMIEDLRKDIQAPAGKIQIASGQKHATEAVDSRLKVNSGAGENGSIAISATNLIENRVEQSSNGASLISSPGDGSDSQRLSDEPHHQKHNFDQEASDKSSDDGVGLAKSSPKSLAPSHDLPKSDLDAKPKPIQHDSTTKVAHGDGLHENHSQTEPLPSPDAERHSSVNVLKALADQGLQKKKKAFSTFLSEQKYLSFQHFFLHDVR
eukprot:TRINITY_DN8543_c0_g1_i4.p1 TRINITY_DN8543_c0_g1~~TRINITY_DN8543_c0_g1_i4.p1  ORF type:complete len:633 (+),score=113.56 TRINITY_DN8543_c0_g1_i4:53-1951(+)